MIQQKHKNGFVFMALIVLMMIFGTMVFAENNSENVYTGMPRVKIFAMYNGEPVTDFICFTESFGGTQLSSIKERGQNYATVYFERGVVGNLYIVPIGYEHLAVTPVDINFNDHKNNTKDSEAKSIIVEFDKPMYEIPLFESRGVAIDNVNYAHYHANVGKTEDDPWVSKQVGISKDGYINLQPLEKGDYWLEIRTISDAELSIPSRMLFSVTKNGEIAGLDDYIRYSKVDVEVTTKFKRGSDKYPYSTSFNLYKQGTDGIGGRTWLVAYFTKEAKPALFTGLNDGTYDYRIGVRKEADDEEIYDYWGELEVDGDDYDFNLPAGCPVNVSVSSVGKNIEVGESEIIESDFNDLIIYEESLVLEYNQELFFEDEHVKLEFGDRVGQADEMITLRKLNTSTYGDTIETIKMPFSVKNTSPIYEVVTSKNGDDLSYDITIPMMKNMVTDSYKVMGYGYDSANKTWVPLGGIVDSSQGTVKMGCKDYCVFLLAQGNPLFYDLGDYEWARSSVEVLAARNIVRGYDDGSYKPDKPVTKAEFITMLVNSLDLKGKEDITMVDTLGKWHERYMSIAIDYDLIEIDNGLVYPDQALNREEMATILGNAMKLYPNVAYMYDESVFEDADSISFRAQEGVRVSQRYGLMNGRGNGFYPKDNTNRAEAARVIYQLSLLTGYLN